MKIYLSIVCFSLFLITSTHAQHVNLGIKGGLNLYSIHSDNNAETKIKPGFNLGLLGHIHIKNKFALQPEIVFSSQGYKYKLITGDHEKVSLNYINIPVLFQYMFNNGFRIQAGPQLGILVGARSKNNNNSIKTKDNFKNMDIGIAAGVSYVHPPSGFGVDARYNLGITNINKYGNVNSFNRGLQLGIFYLINHRN